MSQDLPTIAQVVDKLSLDSRHPGQRFTEGQKEQIIALCFARMGDGASLSRVCEEIDVPISTVTWWIERNIEWKDYYEQLKIIRSRVLHEEALDKLHQMETMEQAKIADTFARYVNRLASLLNPREFSEKLHHGLSKNVTNTGSISFTLNFAGNEQPKGELTVVSQPDDGDST